MTLKRIPAMWLGTSSRLVVMTLVAIGLLLTRTPSYGAEVNGIYTEAATKDLGEITKVDFFKGLKFRGWIDTYFVANFNDPTRSVVDLNQNLSVVNRAQGAIVGWSATADAVLRALASSHA